MKSANATSLLNSIDMTISNINIIASNNIIRYSIINPVESAYMAGYLIVYICGIFEQSIEEIVKAKVSRLNRKYISNYVENSMHQGFRNPSCENIKIFLQKFNSNWVQAITSLPLRNKDALTSIVNNKNLLAHGSPINLTLSEAINYYYDSRLVIEKIDNTIL